MKINKLPEGEEVITLEYGRLRQDIRDANGGVCDSKQNL